jgi:GntR family transcriptional regulator
MTEDIKLKALISDLRERIKRGDFGTNGHLPPVTQLAKNYQVSRGTVYQALTLLQSESLLVTVGSTYIVNYPIMRISGAPLFDKYIREQGLTPVVDNLVEPEVIIMPDEIAKVFGQKEGLHVVHRARRHGIIEIPYRLEENWYPADLAAQFLEAMIKDPNLNVAGEIRKAHNVFIAKRRDKLIARLPTDEETEKLNIVRTTPIIELRRQFLAEDDTVVLFNITILVAAYFELEYDAEMRVRESIQEQATKE